MKSLRMDLYESLQAACGRCQAGLVALSGGLDSSIIAYMLQERNLRGVAVISEDFIATDLTYCQTISSHLGMELQMIRPDAADLLSAAYDTVQILGNFNDIEIRNSAVMYIAISTAREWGADSIITGDGADELFAGYDYMVRMKPDRLGQELERLRRIMHFTSQKIGQKLGVRVESPFLDAVVRQAALSIPPDAMTGAYHGRVMGKLPLRHLFEGKIPQGILRRAKSPIQEGAGTAGLISLADVLITDGLFEESRKEILSADGISIRTKESLLYYREYRRHFGVPDRSPDGCPHCGYAIMQNSKFCRMCGAYPV